MKVRAILFDLDDTLVDFQPAWKAALDETLTFLAGQTGYSDARIQEVWADNWRQALTELAAGKSMAEVRDARFSNLLRGLEMASQSLAAELENKLGASLLRHLRRFGDTQVLTELGLRYPLGIVTNGADDEELDSQRTKARHVGLLDQVQFFLTSDAAGCRKPEPEILLHACRQMSFLPEEVAYVGDSIENDVKAAKRAGMLAIHLDRRRQGSPSGAGLRPDLTVSSLDELREVFA